MRKARTRLTLLVLLSLGIAKTIDAQVTVTEIPPPVEGASCWSEDINDQGEVLVRCSDGSGYTFFVWSLASSTATPVVVPNANVWCFDINELHQVLCNGNVATIWSPAGNVELPEYVVYALNDLGETLGYHFIAGSFGIRRADGTFVPLDVPLENIGLSLNNNSQVFLKTGGTWGLWSPTGFVAVPGPPEPFAPYNINDAGQVTGTMGDGSFSSPYRGIRFTPGEGWRELQIPAGIVNGSGWGGGINVNGQVAASVWIDGDFASERAVFWPTPDAPIDLGFYGGQLTWGYRINALSQIAGGSYANFSFDPMKALVWNTAPPPPPTTTQQIDATQGQVETLLSSGALASGDAESLIAKLDGAARTLDTDGAIAARNILNAVSNQVNALLRSKRISQATADSLTTLLAAAISSL